MDDLPSAVISRRSFTRLICYTLVGIASNLAGYLVYLLLTSLGTTPKISMTLLYGAGAAVGFLGNSKLTFAHNGSLPGAGARFVIAHCIGYFINLAILVLLVDKLEYAHQWAQAIAILVVAAFLFLAFKLYVFREPDVSNTEAQ